LALYISNNLFQRLKTLFLGLISNCGCRCKFSLHRRAKMVYSGLWRLKCVNQVYNNNSTYILACCYHKLSGPATKHNHMSTPQTTVIPVCGAPLQVLPHILLSRYHRRNVAPHAAIVTCETLVYPKARLLKAKVAQGFSY
jgi:hypothetical protein